MIPHLGIKRSRFELALTYLHAARLIIEGADKSAARITGELIHATREQIRRLELSLGNNQI